MLLKKYQSGTCTGGGGLSFGGGGGGGGTASRLFVSVSALRVEEVKKSRHATCCKLHKKRFFFLVIMIITIHFLAIMKAYILHGIMESINKEVEYLVVLFVTISRPPIGILTCRRR